MPLDEPVTSATLPSNEPMTLPPVATNAANRTPSEFLGVPPQRRRVSVGAPGAPHQSNQDADAPGIRPRAPFNRSTRAADSAIRSANAASTLASATRPATMSAHHRPPRRGEIGTRTKCGDRSLSRGEVAADPSHDVHVVGDDDTVVARGRRSHEVITPERLAGCRCRRPRSGCDRSSPGAPWFRCRAVHRTRPRRRDH